MTQTDDFEYDTLPLDGMSFMLDAECFGMDSKLFFPEKGKHVSSEARQACDRCDVQPECLDWALKYEEWGFWAGTTEMERKAMRRIAA